MISRSDSKISLPDQRGFGLIHVLIILVSFTAMVLGSVALLEPGGRTGASTQTWQKLETLKAAVLAYSKDTGAAPADLDSLVSSTGPGCAADLNPVSPTFRQLRGWCGPYIQEVFSGGDLFKRDGWGTPLRYNGAALLSCGPNRNCGDQDDISIAL